MGIIRFLFEFFWLTIPAALFGCFLLALLLMAIAVAYVWTIHRERAQ